ncbi:hypothetical protein RIF29_25722 [Crotalaria pallida]|uniref:Uncharacterized protein n=1 Tax=Crotalaria pallida TaxID=3830 RepID=A0AAN9HZZ5_CROPI
MERDPNRQSWHTYILQTIKSNEYMVDNGGKNHWLAICLEGSERLKLAMAACAARWKAAQAKKEVMSLKYGLSNLYACMGLGAWAIVVVDANELMFCGREDKPWTFFSLLCLT